MHTSITANTAIASSGIAPANTSAAFVSTVNAMIAAPNTINGERKSKRSVRFTPVCAWLLSLVSLVTSVETPTVSRSENESD